jgi:adenylate cyclase class 2
MDGAKPQEVEVKLPFPSASDARDALQRIGANEVQARLFEDNIVLDRTENALAPAGRLLRLRRYGETATLTFKAPVPGKHRHKVREEHETQVADFDATRRILEYLGFTPCYRYQKYRTLLELGKLQICLDETPIGCFVELEGPPEEIDQTAEKMGITVGQYVLETYRELHVQAAGERGEEPGDLVFDGKDDRPI